MIARPHLKNLTLLTPREQAIHTSNFGSYVALHRWEYFGHQSSKIGPVNVVFERVKYDSSSKIKSTLRFLINSLSHLNYCYLYGLKSFWNQSCLWICQNDAVDPEHDFFGSKNTKPIWSFHTLWRDNFKIINLIKYFNTLF